MSFFEPLEARIALAGNTVSGFVYVDHDGSASRDAHEAGVPGVQIELSGEDIDGVSVSRTVLTQNDGSYQFEEVPEGTYTLTQTQPAALLDGTTTTEDADADVDGNEISNLSVNGDSSSNNFGESQLRAAYHSIVLFFAKQRRSQASVDVFREIIAIAEEDAGNDDLARAIRNTGAGDVLTPRARNDRYTASVDQTLTIDADLGVLANDTDPNGDSLTATLVTTSSNGTLELANDGSFSYQPNLGFTGSDTFTYTATDGTHTSNPATVTIDVVDDSPNTPPVASDDTYSVDEDTTLTVNADLGVLDNDTDADTDDLTAALRTDTSHGTLNLNADGSLTYTPDANFNGTDSFTYMARDGEDDSADATVTITVNPVNDPPEAQDDSFDMNEDGTLSRTAQSGVLANDSDVENSTLTVNLVSGPEVGNLTLNENGSFVYSPDANFHGDITFTYEVSDGDLTDQATATISVAAVEDVPVANSDNYTMDEDTTLAIDATMSLLANDTDADGDTLTAILEDDVDHGTLSLNADGTFTYVPEANFAGTDTFTYRANDGNQNSQLAIATIQVTDIDDQGHIVLPAEFSDRANIPKRLINELLEIDVHVEDIDDTDYTYMLDLESSGIPQDASQPTIDANTGKFSWTPTATGRFEIRIIVVNGDREADQATFLVDILSSHVDTEI